MGPEEMGRGGGEMLRGPQLSMKSCGDPTFPELGLREGEVERLIIEGLWVLHMELGDQLGALTVADLNMKLICAHMDTGTNMYLLHVPLAWRIL